MSKNDICASGGHMGQWDGLIFWFMCNLCSEINREGCNRVWIEGV